MRQSCAFMTVLFCLPIAASSCAAERAAVDPNAGQTAPPASSAPAQAPSATAPASNTENEHPAVAALVQPKTPNPDTPVAKVNGVPILAREVSDALTQFLHQQKAPDNLPEDQLKQIRQAILDALIGRELLYQKSKSEGITATQPEIDKVMSEAKKAFPTEEAFQQSLKDQGLDSAG